MNEEQKTSALICFIVALTIVTAIAIVCRTAIRMSEIENQSSNPLQIEKGSK